MKTIARLLAASLILFATLFLSTAPVQADDKRPHLPMSVSNAKTIYVDNQTTSAELHNTAYTELLKWGRFQIVDTPQKADIILRLSSGNYVKFVPGDSSTPTNAPNASKQNWMGADEAVPPGSTRISVIDPKAGNSLWSDIRKTDNPKAATHMLDSFREAFDHHK
jgi:hypothetical protein